MMDIVIRGGHKIKVLIFDWSIDSILLIHWLGFFPVVKEMTLLVLDVMWHQVL